MSPRRRAGDTAADAASNRNATDALVDKNGDLFGDRVFRLGMEEDRQDGRGEQAQPERDQEDLVEKDLGYFFAVDHRGRRVLRQQPARQGNC